MAVLTIQTALTHGKLLMISFHTDQMIAYIFAVNIESTTVATFRTTKNYLYFNLSPNLSYKIN